MNRLPGQLRADLQDRLLGSLCKAGIAQIAGIVCQHMSRYVNNGTCLKCHAAMLARTSIRQKVWTCKPLVMDIPLTSLPKVFVFLSFMFYAAKVLGLHAATALLREWRTLDKACAGTAGTAFRGRKFQEILKIPEIQLESIGYIKGYQSDTDFTVITRCLAGASNIPHVWQRGSCPGLS